MHEIGDRQPASGSGSFKLKLEFAILLALNLIGLDVMIWSVAHYLL